MEQLVHDPEPRAFTSKVNMSKIEDNVTNVTQKVNPFKRQKIIHEIFELLHSFNEGQKSEKNLAQ